MSFPTVLGIKFYTDSILIVLGEMGIFLKEKIILKFLMQAYNRYYSCIKFDLIFVMTRS